MKKKNMVLFGLVLVLLAGFVLVLSSGLFSQSVVGGQTSQASCQSYLRNTQCVQTSTSINKACTDCTLQSLGYTAIIDGKSYTSLWRADCVNANQVTDSKHTFCGAVAPVGVKYCMDSSHLCTNYVLQSDGLAVCNNAYVTCPDGCVKGTSGTGDYCREGATAPISELCYNKCNSVADIKCSGSGYVTCQRQSNGCLDWSSSLSYCGSGKECSSGSCITTPVVVPPVASVCDTSRVCTGTYTYDRTYSDCQVIEKTCASGTECKSGSCVAIPVAPPVVNLCSGVTCTDSCNAKYDSLTNGVCNSATGECDYGNVETLSNKCLPVPNDNETSVIIPIRPDAEKTWVEKYGFVVLGVIMVVLISLYISMSTKNTKGKKRR